MRINFELNTENENPSMLQATAEYLNNLANINAGATIEPVQGFYEPKADKCACEEEKPVEEPKKAESIAESIEAVKEQLAAEKEEAKKTTRRRAAKKEEPEPDKKPIIGIAAKKGKPEVTEPDVAEPDVAEPEVTEPEVTKPEVTKEPEPAKEPVTIEQAKAVAMKALNKGRRDAVKDAFGHVGATSFPSLPAEKYADFIKYIEDNL